MPGLHLEGVAMTQPNPEPTPTPGDPAPTPPVPAPAPPASPPQDEPLGAPGLKALQTERAAREALERKLAALAPLEKLAEMFGGGQPAGDGGSAVDQLQERFTRYETDLKSEREARWRAEVAQSKGLTAKQAARLIGNTREEFEADADELLATFPGAPAGDPNTPRTPAPDPSQGARGTGPADLDSQIAAAEQAGDTRKAIALKTQKLRNPSK
jgi:hypothetical protein